MWPNKRQLPTLVILADSMVRARGGHEWDRNKQFESQTSQETNMLSYNLFK